MTRFLIADDHAILRAGIKQILQTEFPSAIIEEAGDVDELIGKIRKEKWSMIISDLAMPGGSGLDVLQQVHIEFPSLPVLILSMYPEEQFAPRLLKAGAFGYLNKEAVPTELTKAVRHILQGRKYITAIVAEKLADDLQHDRDREKPLHEILSNREFDIFQLLASGKTVGEIAEILSLGVTTVSTHRSRILGKMNLKNNAELIMYAVRNSLV